MSKNGMNIRKRNDGRWEVRIITHYKTDGKPHYRSIYGRSCNEVKNKLLDMSIKNKNKCKNSYLKYNDILHEWLNKTKVSIKEQTYTKYLFIIKNHLEQNIGKNRINKINTDIINNFIADKLQSGNLITNKQLSVNTIKLIRYIIKSSIEYAVSKNLCSPLEKLNKLPTSHHTIETLTKREQKILEQYLLNNSTIRNIGLYLCLYSGLRIGEICALTWNDIDLNSKVIKITKTIQRIKNLDNKSKNKTKLLISNPKSVSSNRIIPISKKIIIFTKSKSM